MYKKPVIIAMAVVIVVMAAYILYNRENFDTYGNYRVASEIVTGQRWPYGRYAIAQRDKMGRDIYDALSEATLFPRPLEHRDPGYMYAAPDSYGMHPGLTVNGVVVELNQGY